MVNNGSEIYEGADIYNTGMGGGGGSIERVFLTYFKNVIDGEDYPEIGEKYTLQNADIVTNKIFVDGNYQNCQKVNNTSFLIDLTNYIQNKNKAFLTFFFVRESTSGTTRMGIDSPDKLPHIILPVGSTALRTMFTGNGGGAPNDNQFLARFTSYNSNFAEAIEILYSSISTLHNSIQYVFDFEQEKATCIFNGYPIFSCEYKKENFNFFAESLTYAAYITAISLDVI